MQERREGTKGERDISEEVIRRTGEEGLLRGAGEEARRQENRREGFEICDLRLAIYDLRFTI